jgi:hypothetical protein
MSAVPGHDRLLTRTARVVPVWHGCWPFRTVCQSRRHRIVTTAFSGIPDVHLDEAMQKLLADLTLFKMPNMPWRLSSCRFRPRPLSRGNAHRGSLGLAESWLLEREHGGYLGRRA